MKFFNDAPEEGLASSSQHSFLTLGGSSQNATYVFTNLDHLFDDCWSYMWGYLDQYNHSMSEQS